MPLATRVQALEELEGVAQELTELHRQLGDLEAAEHTARVQAWFASDSEYVSARDRVAEFNTLHITPEVLKLRGEIAALVSRRAFLEFLIHWGP